MLAEMQRAIDQLGLHLVRRENLYMQRRQLPTRRMINSAQYDRKNSTLNH